MTPAGRPAGSPCAASPRRASSRSVAAARPRCGARRPPVRRCRAAAPAPRIPAEARQQDLGAALHPNGVHQHGGLQAMLQEGAAEAAGLGCGVLARTHAEEVGGQDGRDTAAGQRGGRARSAPPWRPSVSSTTPMIRSLIAPPPRGSAIQMLNGAEAGSAGPARAVEGGQAGPGGQRGERGDCHRGAGRCRSGRGRAGGAGPPRPPRRWDSRRRGTAERSRCHARSRRRARRRRPVARPGCGALSCTTPTGWNALAAGEAEGARIHVRSPGAVRRAASRSGRRRVGRRGYRSRLSGPARRRRCAAGRR